MAVTVAKAVVPLSGGLDSATSLAIARNEGFASFAVTFRYGQRHKAEIDAARRTARDQRVAGFGMIDAVAAVARLGDNRAEGAAKQRRVHLVDDLFEPTTNHGECDGVDHGSLFRTNFPAQTGLPVWHS